MKLLTILSIFFIGGALLTLSATAADVPQNGEMNYKARRERINAALVAKNSPNAVFELSAREGRKARQSCIADYQSLCGDDYTNSSPSLSNNKMVANNKGEGETECATCGKDNKKAAVRSFEEQADMDAQKFKKAGGLGLVPPPNRKRMKLKGMERCLTKKIDQISNPVCKDFISGRQVCFGEAERVCKANIQKAQNAAEKDNERSVDKIKMQCLRDKALRSQFSADCANTTYYQTLSVHNAVRGKVDIRDSLSSVNLRGGMGN